MIRLACAGLGLLALSATGAIAQDAPRPEPRPALEAPPPPPDPSAATPPPPKPDTGRAETALPERPPKPVETEAEGKPPASAPADGDETGARVETPPAERGAPASSDEENDTERAAAWVRPVMADGNPPPPLRPEPAQDVGAPPATAEANEAEPAILAAAGGDKQPAAIEAREGEPHPATGSAADDDAGPVADTAQDKALPPIDGLDGEEAVSTALVDGKPVPAAKPEGAAKPEETDEADDELPATRPQTLPTPPDCMADLEAAGAVFEVQAAIDDGVCGAEEPVEVRAVGKVRFASPALLRCDAALALVRWTADVVQPSAVLHLGVGVSEVAVGSSYVCRGRRTGNGSGGKLSEHAIANAVDVSAVVLGDGRRVAVAPREGAEPERVFQAAIRGGACALFTTVLGPGTNALHADHLHLDRAYRRGGYRLCE